MNLERRCIGRRNVAGSRQLPPRCRAHPAGCLSRLGGVSRTVISAAITAPAGGRLSADFPRPEGTANVADGRSGHADTAGRSSDCNASHD